MTLKRMLNFEPNDEDMAILPLDVTVYIKMSIVSASKSINYDFLRYLFTSEDISYYLKDHQKTVFYDFDATETSQEKFVTIVEMYSKFNYSNTSEYMKEILENYSHDADVIMDFYTHDSKAYRLSNLDGVVKLEEMKKDKENQLS